MLILVLGLISSTENKNKVCVGARGGEEIKAMVSGIQSSLAVILPWHMVPLFFVISEDEQATWLL